MAEIKVFGYANKISVKPGDDITFYAHADGTTEAEAQLVRLIHGDEHPAGPGFMEEEIASELDGSWSVKKQFTQVGNFLTVDDPSKKFAIDGSLTLCAFVHPIMHGDGIRQALLGRWDIYKNEGFALWLNQKGVLEFGVGDGREVDYLGAEVPLMRHVWYFVAATFDAGSGAATLYQEPILGRYNNRLGKVAPVDYRSHVQESFRFRAKNGPDVPFITAGARDWHELRGHFIAQTFNGKIDRHGVFDRALNRAELDHIRDQGKPSSMDGVVAFWDTTIGYTDWGIGDEVIDIGPNELNALGCNRPVRAMTGYNWKGRNDCFRLAPEEFGGIEFHSDAIIDCGWEPSRNFTVPDLKSGAYAVRLRAGRGEGLGEEYIVFFVRPSVPKAKIAFLVPTASYLAYANEHLSFDSQMVQPIMGQPPIVSEVDIELYQTPDFGLSTYDVHADGGGVCYTSYLRPILNMRPKCRIAAMGITWQFPADLSIIAWLEHQDYDYEIVTDEDLHREGEAALAPYNCVITGSHPEYYSERMLDATEDYVAAGGRYIYMGGNGYYWHVGFREGEPWCMEVRKLEAGTRAWQARPGEHYLASGGERSGLWRHAGRAPQKLTGVGFIAQGFETARPYRRMPDSWHRRVDWIFEGIEGEIIGDFGLAHHGAAGIEVDRYDLTLGTPPHTLILASSGGHSDNYMLVQEELMFNYPGATGTTDYRVRADMVIFDAPNDGAVFSTGSIGFGQSLPHDKFDNNCSRLLKNVVDAFAKSGPLPGAHWTAEEKQWR
ncbi:MAG: N,N-dimethylformamidase beta subunit family domain-containing protein [Geminicoccaceae bacterium]